MTQPSERQFLTAYEIADTLGISKSAAYDVILRNLPYVRVGRIYRVRRKAFEDWLHRQETAKRR